MIRTLTSLVLALGLACGQALAANISFLDNTPLSKMSASDLNLFKETLQQALDHNADGVPLRWSNDKSGTSGEITPLDRFERDGTTCRRTAVVNNVRGKTGNFTWDFCQGPDGQWRMQMPSQ